MKAEVKDPNLIATVTDSTRTLEEKVKEIDKTFIDFKKGPLVDIRRMAAD